MTALSPLYVICDADVCERSGWTLVDFASACLDGGARLLQIRAKRMPAGRLLEDTAAIVSRASGAGAVVVVNDRADIARLAAAGGVHVGQDDLSPSAVREIVGNEVLVGRSTHTPEQLEAALIEPISYVAIGPIFGTSTKETGYDAVGLERIREAAATVRSSGLPLVAIGGITIERVHAVLQAGATSAAVISDLLATGDPTARVRDYLKRLTL